MATRHIIKQNWTKEDIDKAIALKLKGLSDYQIADKMHRSFGSVNTKLARLKLEGKVKSSVVPESTMPLWNKPLKSEGDAVILTDVEAPFQHSEFINKVLDLADSWNVSTLHLGGDLLHYDNLSAWGSEWVQDKEEMLNAFILPGTPPLVLSRCLLRGSTGRTGSAARLR